MHTLLPTRTPRDTKVIVLVSMAVLCLAILLGSRTSIVIASVLAVGFGGMALVIQPVLGLFLSVGAALLLPTEFGTGSDVKLNTVTLLIPLVFIIWAMYMVRRRDVHFVRSPVYLPLFLFVGANLLSLLIGRIYWDPTLPVRDSFVIVQLAQWSIFAFAAMVFWLTGNLVKSEDTLWRLTALFIILAGGVSVLKLIPGLGGTMDRISTPAFYRAPLWVLLASSIGGQLLWNRRLSPLWRIFLIVTLCSVVVHAFLKQRDSASTWVGVTVAWGVLVWLRFPKLRLPLSGMLLGSVALGVVFPILWDFAGGDAEWILSGESRLTLIGRVVEVTMRNPITGLGPAAYRVYASWQPLTIAGNQLWIGSVVSSHNNYVDIFSQGGAVGLVLLGWFVVRYVQLAITLRQRFYTGFAAGYLSAMLATGAGALVIMMLADWILPFVYNVGFQGFQASVLVWLFLGGTVVLYHIPSTFLENGET